jgi:hypothetical protein
METAENLGTVDTDGVDINASLPESLDAPDQSIEPTPDSLSITEQVSFAVFDPNFMS